MACCWKQTSFSDLEEADFLLDNKLSNGDIPVHAGTDYAEACPRFDSQFVLRNTSSDCDDILLLGMFF